MVGTRRHDDGTDCGEWNEAAQTHGDILRQGEGVKRRCGGMILRDRTGFVNAFRY
jgi:hypothetical protein